MKIAICCVLVTLAATVTVAVADDQQQLAWLGNPLACYFLNITSGYIIRIAGNLPEPWQTCIKKQAPYTATAICKGDKIDWVQECRNIFTDNDQQQQQQTTKNDDSSATLTSTTTAPTAQNRHRQFGAAKKAAHHKKQHASKKHHE